MEYVLIWHGDAEARAMIVSEVSDVLIVNNSKYSRHDEEYIGDYDCLRNQKKQLIGFSLVIDEQIAIFKSSLIRNSRNVRNEEGFLIILLAESECYDIDVVQIIGAIQYRDLNGNFILALPRWDCWGELGFKQSKANIIIEHETGNQ